MRGKGQEHRSPAMKWTVTGGAIRPSIDIGWMPLVIPRHELQRQEVAFFVGAACEICTASFFLDICRPNNSLCHRKGACRRL